MSALRRIHSSVVTKPVMIARRTECPGRWSSTPIAWPPAKWLLDNHQCRYRAERRWSTALRNWAAISKSAVIDGERGLGNGLCLPAGPLDREPAVAPEGGRFRVRERSGEVEVARQGEADAAGTIRPSSMWSRGERSSAGIRRPRCMPVAGVGHPDRFFRMLRDLDLRIMEHPFADHRRFILDELMFGDNLPVIMTGKDAIEVGKLGPEVIHEDFWYLEVDVAMEERFMEELLKRVCDNKDIEVIQPIADAMPPAESDQTESNQTESNQTKEK
ncbi:MAG: tetraacyldisaccharide 4'-kinase [Gammaproteobacteria bacterium]|nr:tetraacyldisaccharide 4'-kinase [Gammaproteobacteria bacterium]